MSAADTARQYASVSMRTRWLSGEREEMTRGRYLLTDFAGRPGGSLFAEYSDERFVGSRRTDERSFSLH
jgi:hypothetical protein